MGEIWIFENFFQSLFFSIFLFACGGGDSTPGSACTNSNLAMGSITGPAITVKMTLADLPATLPVNQSHTLVGQSEYRWGVVFDLNSDEQRSTGDILFELHHLKKPNAQEGTCYISDFHAVIFEFTSPDTLTGISDAAVSIEGNTIILKAPISSHQSLENIDYNALVQFGSSGYDVNGNQPDVGIYGDSFPVTESKAGFSPITTGASWKILIQE